MSSQDSSSATSNFSGNVYQDMLFNSLLTTRNDWPALNEGEFKTDNFRMYNFKVYPCCRTYVHVWSECPFYHSGENARRRDPRIFKYSPLQCQAFRTTGSCAKGDECEFAHGLFETWLHPGQYRTRVCRDRGHCTRPMCFFAHDHLELRSLYTKTGSAERQLPPRASQPLTFPTARYTDQSQTHQLGNLRMLQNIGFGRSDSAISFGDNALGLGGHSIGASSFIQHAQSLESYAGSDSFFSCGPFFGCDYIE